MIKKNTYLVRVISSENEPRLEEISGKEWKQIVSANKNLPNEQKRYFMVSRIPVNGGYDRMYIEIPYEEYKSWKNEFWKDCDGWRNDSDDCNAFRNHDDRLRLSTKDRESCQHIGLGGNSGFRTEPYIQRGRAGSAR